MPESAKLECSRENLRIIANNQKFVEGKNGWLFLANDTNDHFSQQFGFMLWDREDARKAQAIMAERVFHIPTYKQFIVPEKSLVYREFLPESMSDWEDVPYRPALQISSGNYLLPEIMAAKPMGSLYFRGDTHPNWMGSYFIYVAISKGMGLSPLPLHAFTPSLAGYDGDLFGYLSDAERTAFLARVPHFPFTFDIEMQLHLANPKARHVGQDGYDHFSRETLVYENPDASLPKAVIFRDSTSQFTVPWLAEHFSRSVFVWHRGEVLNSVIEREAPDVVFQVMAERFVWSYPDRVALS